MDSHASRHLNTKQLQSWSKYKSDITLIGVGIVMVVVTLGNTFMGMGPAQSL